MLVALGQHEKHLLVLLHSLSIKFIFEGPFLYMGSRLVDFHLLSNHPFVVLFSLIEIIFKLHNHFLWSCSLKLLHGLLIADVIKFEVIKPLLVLMYLPTNLRVLNLRSYPNNLICEVLIESRHVATLVRIAIAILSVVENKSTVGSSLHNGRAWAYLRVLRDHAEISS